MYSKQLSNSIYNDYRKIVTLRSGFYIMDAHKKTVLFISALSSFLTPFMGSSINLALPAIAKEFGMNAIFMSWVVSSYLLTSAIFLIPIGKVADMFGRKRIFLTGIIVFTLSSILSALSVNSWMLISARVVQGIGSTMIFGTGMAILTSVFPEGERGKALGINVSAVYIGLATGPFAGGILTQYLGWRSIFWILVPVGIITVLLIILYLKGEWHSEKEEKFDWAGAFVYAASLTLIMLGFTDLTVWYGVLLLGTGILMLVLFLYIESHFPYPLLDLSLFRQNRTFAFSNLAALINYSATFAIVFLLSLYLQYIKGFTPRDAGLILLSQPIIMAFFSPITGTLSDRIDPRIIASIGMGFSSVGLGGLAMLTSSTSILYIIIVLLVLGCGFALFSSPNTNAIMSSVRRSHYGIASAMVGTMRLTGQMFSMGIAMLILSFFIGKTVITPSNAHSFITALKVSFSLFGLLCFIGIFASLARGKKDNHNNNSPA